MNSDRKNLVIGIRGILIQEGFRVVLGIRRWEAPVLQLEDGRELMAFYKTSEQVRWTEVSL